MGGLNILCSLLCYVFLNRPDVAGVRIGHIVFYVCYAWIYFCALWTVAAMGRYRNSKRFLIPMGLLSIYMTAIILGSFAGSKPFIMAKHIFLGRSWWIAEPHPTPSVFLSMRAFYWALGGQVIILLIALIVYSFRADKMFRLKFYIIFLCEALYIVPQYFTFRDRWPIWILGTIIHFVLFVWFYYVNYFSTNRLRDRSLANFANEMSDGFILFDEYDDPIHMNDLLKDTFSEDLVEEFRDKNRLDEWLGHITYVSGSPVREYVKSNGERVYFKVKKDVMGTEGTPYGTIYILHDSTDTILRMKAMEQVNAELERAAKMKSDFLANMSHELRTPMNAVIGMAEIALREKLPDNVAEYLRRIQGSGRSLLGIINDILDFSKIEAGKMEIIPERYEPLTEINDIADMLVTRIGDKNIELFVDVDKRIPHALYGDAMRIRQVIVNLVNNAIKFTEEGVVLLRIICEKTSSDDVLMTFHVIDTGVGIKPEDKERLFASFEQADSKRNRAVEGTGLGLAISRRLCEGMGGTLDVVSEYGKGSDFFFTIPQKILDGELDIVVKDAEHKRAIVFDDRPDMTEQFVIEVRKLGVEAVAITDIDGYEAVEGKKDYFFFKKPHLDDKLRRLLSSYPELTGVVLVDFDDEFKPDIPNLRIMRRPETTLNMLSMLNDKELARYKADTTTAFEYDFSSPDARILIVDDNAINITVAEGLLEPVGAKCTGVLSGKDAIEALEKEHYDIVLMDHMMPEMDGVEATRIIRDTIEGAADIPIIAVTANVMEGVKEMFIENGMNDFVGKPIDVKDLISVVKKWLPQEKIKPVTETAFKKSSGTAPSVNKDVVIEYDCLDHKTALSAMGSAKLYNRIVEEYYNSGREKLDGIRIAFEKEDWQDYTIRVHALKSSSRQIGAMALGDSAERLEKAGKANDTNVIKNNTEALLEEYRLLLNKLAHYFDVRRRVLLIDDDPVTLKSVKGYLDDDYDVALAVSGRVAYKYLEKKHVDVVLLDYEMPEENGHDVFEHIRKMDCENKNVPIVFMTGTDESDILAKTLKLKPDGYLAKPVNIQKLKDMISGLIAE